MPDAAEAWKNILMIFPSKKKVLENLCPLKQFLSEQANQTITQ